MAGSRMKIATRSLAAGLPVLPGASWRAAFRGRPDPGQLLAAQREAMAPPEFMDEAGERIVPGREPTRILEAELVRLGDGDWPAAGAVPPE